MPKDLSSTSKDELFDVLESLTSVFHGCAGKGSSNFSTYKAARKMIAAIRGNCLYCQHCGEQTPISEMLNVDFCSEACLDESGWMVSGARGETISPKEESEQETNLHPVR